MPASQKRKISSKRVKVEIFSIHGHTTEGPLDYKALFNYLNRLAAKDLTVPVAERFMAVRPIAYDQDTFTFAAYSGSTDPMLLVLDLESTAEEFRSLEPGKFVARKTLGVVDLNRREVAIQFIQNGPRAAEIASLFEKVGRTLAPEQFPALTLEFAPVPGGEFIEQLQLFARIQSAHLKITRPNYDWEEYGEALTTLGQDSNARNLEVVASANRNGTLQKDTGVIGLIKDLVGRSRSILKSVTVIGSRGDDAGLVTLKLDRHIKSIRVEIPLEVNGQPKQQELQQAMTEFLTERPVRVE